jgi:hypothetical protein
MNKNSCNNLFEIYAFVDTNRYFNFSNLKDNEGDGRTKKYSYGKRSFI